MAFKTSVVESDARIVNRNIRRRTIPFTSVQSIANTTRGIFPTGTYVVYETETKSEEWYALTQAAIETYLGTDPEPTSGVYAFSYSSDRKEIPSFTLTRDFEGVEELKKIVESEPPFLLVLNSENQQVETGGQIFGTFEDGYFFQIRAYSNAGKAAIKIDGTLSASEIDDIIVSGLGKDIPIEQDQSVAIQFASYVEIGGIVLIGEIQTKTYTWGGNLTPP
jgi:hypothetical protein